jgi:hypothetical protein
VSRAIQFSEPVVFEKEDCCTCGVVFFVPNHLQAEAKKTGRTFYCPNGHSLIYRDTEMARLRNSVKEWEAYALAEKERKERALADANSARAALDVAQKEKAKLRKHVERTKNGVCPCCTRSFTNLRRHMSTKHPEFTP